MTRKARAYTITLRIHILKTQLDALGEQQHNHVPLVVVLPLRHMSLSKPPNLSRWLIDILLAKVSTRTEHDGAFDDA